MSLHRARLRRPQTAEHYVRRPRLLELLGQVTRAPLTLVVAPAGTGKTSLVSGWVAESAIDSAWLSLDELDRDDVQFWSGVISALETLVPGCGDRALATMRRPAPRAVTVDELLVDLEGAARPPAVLVIDDLHFVDADDAVAASLARFVEHLPSWLHLVLVSRREPPLPIDRMRSRGQLGEIRVAELRFSPDEAVELLERLAPTLSATGVEAAVTRADGWAASLQFAALAARSAHAQSHSAPRADDDVLVEDYVLHEVLGNEPTEVIDVLAAAAVVPRINAGLAHALTGRHDAGDLLHRAVGRGLFMTRRGAGGWFDLHSVVARVLRADLASRSPGRLAAVHAGAARWFEEAGEVIVALEQWRLAERPREVLRLLSANAARLYDTGRDGVVARTLAAIPTSVAMGDLEAMVEFAWCHLLVDRRRFVELVDQVAWWADRSAAHDTLHARVGVLRGAAATASGRWVESGELYRRVMADLADSWWEDQLGRFAPNGLARSIALSERWDRSAEDVRQTEAAVSRDPERRLSFEGIRAVGVALAGRPLDALRVAAGVRRAAEVTEMTILRTELAVAEAVARRELGDRSRAMTELQALAVAPAEPMLYCRILAMCELAQAHLDSGDLDSARQTLAEAEALADEESLGSDGRAWVARVGTLVALAGGDATRARVWAEQVDDPFWGPIGGARVELAAGDRSAAIDALDSAVPRCVRHDVVLALLKARALPDRDEAAKSATIGAELACGCGLLQTVASEGQDVVEVVERAAWRVPAAWLERLRRSTAQSPRGDEAVRLVEPLTERERAVLRFLPSRLTVREIADELYVSVNTVKFHLRVIYRKLGVNSRAEAAAIAREITRR